MRPVDLPLAGPLLDQEGLESYYTIWMEALLPKRRILELYANVIEMGPGIYGVEAASQHYFGVSARSNEGAVCNARGGSAESERLGPDETWRDVTMASAAHSAT